MAIEEMLQEQEQAAPDDEQVIAEGAELTKEEETDLKIAVAMAEDLIDEGGKDVLETAKESTDPGQVIGQFLFQMVSQMSEQLPFEMSPRIYFAEGGWIEQVSDYIQEQYGIDKETMDRAEIYIGTAAQEMAQGGKGGDPNAPAQPQQAGPPAPVMPAGGM